MPEMPEISVGVRLVSWKSRNPEFRRNSAGIFKGLFFVNSKRLKSSQRFSEVRIFSEDDPRTTEVSQISPTNNRTAEDTPMVFRLICMYPKEYPICYDLSLCRVPVIRESRAFIMRVCQSRTVTLHTAGAREI